MLYIAFKPTLHKYISCRKCDDRCYNQQEHILLYKHEKDIFNGGSIHFAYGYFLTSLLATERNKGEDAKCCNKHADHGNKAEKLHKYILWFQILCVKILCIVQFILHFRIFMSEHAVYPTFQLLPFAIMVFDQNLSFSEIESIDTNRSWNKDTGLCRNRWRGGIEVFDQADYGGCSVSLIEFLAYRIVHSK